MPISGAKIPAEREPPLFRSLDELDAWAATSPPKLEGILPYVPRPSYPETAKKGKMLICHDYKGGYSENPFDQTYTFNFWSKCETFIYFGHHRITIPPPGWINAAHRQGAKMLGTVIFEPGGESDATRLVTGTFPKKPIINPGTSFPLSAQYAKTLADLAYERGFDGYLMNFEVYLSGGDEARAVAGWLTLLQNELQAKIGPHAETNWYDSVVTNGSISYQNRLNDFNLPFFLSCTSFFSNYWWRPNSTSAPKANVEYFNSLPAALTGSAAGSSPEVELKQINDIYIGIDVWGRGQYGGTGFGLYKALTYIAPLVRNLSVAVFAPGWTWETEENKAGFNWDYWWGRERSLWVGSGSEPGPGNPDSPTGEEGPYVPMASFFALLGPPDPIDLPFFTNFSPGVGFGWWVSGTKVYANAKGWSDLDKQTSIGDLAWPLPAVAWYSTSPGAALPHGSSDIVMTDAFNGGSCLRVKLFHNLSFVVASAPVWVPIQSLNITAQKTYEATLYYKVEQPATDAGLSVSLGAKSLSYFGNTFTVTPVTTAPPPAVPIDGGWKRLVARFTASGTVGNKLQAGLGLVLATTGAGDLPDVSILIGQLSVVGILPDVLAYAPPYILHASFAPSTAAGQAPKGLLKWSTGAAIPSGYASLKTVSQSPSAPQVDDGSQQQLSPRAPNDNLSDIPARYRLPSQVIFEQPGFEAGRVHPPSPHQDALGDHVDDALKSPLPPVASRAFSGLNKNPDNSMLTFETSAQQQLSIWKLQPNHFWFPTLAYANVYAMRFASAAPLPPAQPPSPTLANATWVGTSGLDGRKESFVVVGENLPPSEPGEDKIRFWVQGVTDGGELLGWDRCAYVDVTV